MISHETPSDPQIVVAGHPWAPIGRGEDARSAVLAFEAVGAQCGAFDIWGHIRDIDAEYKNQIGKNVVDQLSPDINLFFLNGNEVQPALEHLGGLKGLKQLNVAVTFVSREGVGKLRAALPDCEIQW